MVNGYFIAYGPSAMPKAVRAKLTPGAGDQPAAESPVSHRDLSFVTARKRLNETAFFFPRLVSNQEGVVRLEFTMPETLTTWKFLGFAHDRQLRAGLLEGEAVTAKELMVQPNPPRFLREGDVLEFTVKVSNQSAQRQTGKLQLTFANSRTGKSVDAHLGNAAPETSFDLPAHGSRSYAWRLSVPDGAEGAVVYKAVASADGLSDGEEAYLPILPRRVLVTQSLPLPVRGPQSKQFNFPQLLRSGESNTLQHRSLTVQMASHPSWYAIMSLPYLMDYPWECSERDLQSAVRERLGPAHHQFESEDSPGLRAVEGHARLGQPPGKEPGVESGVVGGDAVAAAGPSGEPGAAGGWLCSSTTIACKRQLPTDCRDSGSAAGRRRLALVPRRPRRRLHYALCLDRIGAAAASGHQD